MNNPKVLRIAILVLGVATALAHLWLFYNGFSRGRPDYRFLVNGGGYLVLLAAFFLTVTAKDPWHRVAHYLLMAFAAGSIVAWIIVNGGRFLPQLSAFTKAVEVLLIIVLFLDVRLAQRSRGEAFV
jgi:hypothetical protein